MNKETTKFAIALIVLFAMVPIASMADEPITIDSTPTNENNEATAAALPTLALHHQFQPRHKGRNAGAPPARAVLLHPL